MVLAIEVTNDTKSLIDRVFALKTEMQALCSYVEQTMVQTAANFAELMGDAHEICPDYTKMERVLANVAEMADNHYSVVKKQRNECNKLSGMLIDELAGADSLVDYFTEGTYLLVSEIVDGWHQAFTIFEASFSIKDIPTEIIHNNRKIFFYDSWSEGIKEFLFTLFVLLAIPSAVTLIAIFIYQYYEVNSFTDQPARPSLHTTLHTHTNDQDGEAQPIVSDNSNLLRRRVDPQVQTFSDEDTINKPNTSNERPIERKYNTTRTSACSFTVIIILWIFIFSLLMIIMLMQNPTQSLFPKSVRRNWYPVATSAIAQMRNDTKNLHSNISSQIRSIEELHRLASMYRDPDVQLAADDFVENFAAGFRQPSEETANAYLISKRVVSVFRRTYDRIATRAKKLGKLEAAKDLLESLNDSTHHYEIWPHELTTSIAQQKDLLPQLKQQTKSMRELLDKNALIHIIPIVEKHYTILMDIDGNLTVVNVVLKNLIEIVGNTHAYGMKKSIGYITEETLTDQVKAWYLSRLLSAGATIGGLLAFNGGYVLATVTATAIGSPVTAVGGGLAALGFGIYYANQNYNAYNDASRYVDELADLEIERSNMKDALQKIEESIASQLNAFETTRSALSTLKQLCGHYTKDPDYILNAKQRAKISNALDKLLTDYNRMIAMYSTFVQDSTKIHQELPSK